MQGPAMTAKVSPSVALPSAEPHVNGSEDMRHPIDLSEDRGLSCRDEGQPAQEASETGNNDQVVLSETVAEPAGTANTTETPALVSATPDNVTDGVPADAEPRDAITPNGNADGLDGTTRQYLSEIPAANSETSGQFDPPVSTDMDLLQQGITNGIIPDSQSQDNPTTGQHDFPPSSVLPTIPHYDYDTMPGQPYLEHSSSYEAVAPPQQQQGFAKLEFEDGHYYMNTYGIMLGRDRRAGRYEQQLRRRTKQEQADVKHRQKASQEDGADAPQTPIVIKTEDGPSHHQHSYHSHVSESGGILGLDLEHMRNPNSEFFDDEDVKPTRKRKRGNKLTKSKSTSSSSIHSHSQSHYSQGITLAHLHNDVVPDVDAVHYLSGLSSVNGVSDINNPNAVHTPTLTSMAPSPDACPLLAIHPPWGIRSTNISRKHAGIQYNFTTQHFELSVLGVNGAFLDGVLLGKGEVRNLEHKSVVQLGGVCFRFLLPDHAACGPDSDADEAADDDEEMASESGVTGRMSFNFENPRGESLVMDDDEESSSIVRSPIERGYPYDDVDLLVDDDDDDEDSPTPSPEPMPQKKTKLKLKLKIQPPPKRAAKVPARVERKRKEKKKKKTKSIKTKPKEKEKEKEKEADIEPKAVKKEKITPEQPSQAPTEDTTVPKEPTPPKPEEPANAKPSETPAPSETPKAEESTKPLGPNIPDHLIPPRRKGPGRPPKNGIMSKREEAAIKRQLKEAEKAKALGQEPPTLEDVLARSKAKLPKRGNDDEADKADSKKRKLDGELDVSVRPSVEIGANYIAAADRKAARTSKLARSPSPEMKESDYTKEQLERPPHNYVVLIHEAITNCCDPDYIPVPCDIDDTKPAGEEQDKQANEQAQQVQRKQSEQRAEQAPSQPTASGKPKGLNLQQIYAYIERKYPYYKFKVSTTGWQSSVRHNLGQNDAFVRVEREGKGFLWAVNRDISIEREKRKRASPPAQTAPRGGYYPPNGQYPVGPNGPYAPYPQIGQSGQPHGMSLYPGQSPYGPPTAMPPAVSLPNGITTSLPTVGATPSGSYSSPYASAPIVPIVPPGSGPHQHRQHPGPYVPNGQPYPPNSQHRYPPPQPGHPTSTPAYPHTSAAMQQQPSNAGQQQPGPQQSPYSAPPQTNMQQQRQSPYAQAPHPQGQTPAYQASQPRKTETNPLWESVLRFKDGFIKAAVDKAAAGIDPSQTPQPQPPQQQQQQSTRPSPGSTPSASDPSPLTPAQETAKATAMRVFERALKRITASDAQNPLNAAVLSELGRPEDGEQGVIEMIHRLHRQSQGVVEAGAAGGQSGGAATVAKATDAVTVTGAKADAVPAGAGGQAMAGSAEAASAAKSAQEEKLADVLTSASSGPSPTLPLQQQLPHPSNPPAVPPATSLQKAEALSLPTVSANNAGDSTLAAKTKEDASPHPPAIEALTPATGSPAARAV
ncbi:hypothetical protein B0A49_09670 [Cryomyces minteri]|uniref:Fork-head domain-containing protein n=1 Tax=Cryomyces minteri TaxID=331657 RepID=A0A4U0WEN5_9PEZI|nr:hypothetical protein B0A49_09670 [Cryomyces minteri]